jgi:predicted NUDIX family phosphoesterase
MEHVLVVPTSVFHDIGHFQGFTTETSRYLDGLLKPEHMSYRPRAEMEKDPSFKQLIPYVVFRYATPEREVLLFQYTRGTGQGEQRLHSKRSIGIGGHISSDDASAVSVYDEGMRRELAEEVRIDTPYRAHLAGLINDDLTEVGKVHLGVVHLFDVEHLDVYPREEEMIDAGFRPVGELLRDREQFETWSKICLEVLFL